MIQHLKSELMWAKQFQHLQGCYNHVKQNMFPQSSNCTRCFKKSIDIHKLHDASSGNQSLIFLIAHSEIISINHQVPWTGVCRSVVRLERMLWAVLSPCILVDVLFFVYTSRDRTGLCGCNAESAFGPCRSFVCGFVPRSRCGLLFPIWTT